MLRIRLMTLGDAPLGMRLSGEANWNQTEADWRRFLAMEPGGCFVAELDGIARGTVVTCVFGRVGWVATLLVEGAFRGRGIGGRLMRHALAYLEEQGARTVRLDATPMGAPLYRKLGFTEQYRLARFEGVLAPSAPVGAAGRPPERLVEEAIASVDLEVTKTDRKKLLGHLLREVDGAGWFRDRGGGERGFLLTRRGLNAAHVGPFAAATPGVAGELWEAVSKWHEGRRVFWDIPEANEGALDLARSAGLSSQRTFLRMCLGAELREDLRGLWGSSGPEKG